MEDQVISIQSGGVPIEVTEKKMLSPKEIKEKAKQARALKRLQEESSRKEALENVLQNGPIEDIIRWRDAASCRVTKGDSLKKDYIRELDAIEKRTQSDIRWIRKLNNVLNARTFGQQKHTKGERVRVSIRKEVVRI